MTDGDLVVGQCQNCHRGAIHVPEVGPMGDEFHQTIDEARASGQLWTCVDGEWYCPDCKDEVKRIMKEGLD